MGKSARGTSKGWGWFGFGLLLVVIGCFGTAPLLHDNGWFLVVSAQLHCCPLIVRKVLWSATQQCLCHLAHQQADCLKHCTAPSASALASCRYEREMARRDRERREYLREQELRERERSRRSR